MPSKMYTSDEVTGGILFNVLSLSVVLFASLCCALLVGCLLPCCVPTCDASVWTDPKSGSSGCSVRTPDIYPYVAADAAAAAVCT